MADTEQKTPPAPYTPPGQIDPAELTKLFVEDGVITPEAAAKATSTTPAAPAAPAAEKDDLPALVRIAREKDAFRKEKEQLAPHAAVLKRFSPQQLERLAAAAASEDPVAALAALNFTHSQYTSKLLGTKPPEKPAEEPSGDPEVLSVKQELAALKAERENERLQVARQDAYGKMKNTLKDNPKFTSVTAMDAYEQVEAVLIGHWNKFDEMPGATFEESVTLAAEVVEADIRKQAERYRPLLTAAPTSGQVAVKAPETPRPAPESPRTLTNANTSAPAAARTTPKTRDEVIEALSKGEELDDSFL